MNKIKNFAIKKFTISTICLLLFGLFYFYPTHETIKTEVNIKDDKTCNVVYMLDSDNYVSRVTLYFDNKSIEDEIKNKIEILTKGSNDLYEFYPLIPKSTKLNSVKVKKNKVYLDFSKELLTINKYMEESMIEAIVYTISEINGLDTIYINVDGKELKYLPNSNKEIPYPLNRNYGINKEYNLNSLNDISKTTVFFSKNKDDYSYYVPVTNISNKNNEKIDIIIEELKSSINAQNDLNSYFDQNTKLIDYKINNNKMKLEFNDYIFNNKEYIDEEKFILISSIFENYNIDKITINDKYNFKRNNT